MMTGKDKLEKLYEEAKSLYEDSLCPNDIAAVKEVKEDYEYIKQDLERLEKLEKVVEILLPQTIKKIAGVPETLDLYQIKYKKVVNKVHKDLILEIVDILNKKEVLEDDM